jgi:5'-nucleotidase/UDP-sugar diphosphatase
MSRRSRIAASLIISAAPLVPLSVSAPVDAGPGDPLTLNIFHVNDSHSHLDPGSGSVDLGTGVNDPTTPENESAFDYELGGWPRLQTMFESLYAEHPDASENNVAIHAGDAITGTLYYTLFDGEADAAMMNHTCFDIFEVGNHEFDSSDAGLVTFLDFLNADDADPGGCVTDVLGANVVPAPGTPLNPNPDPSVTTDDYLQPYVIKEYTDFAGDPQRVAFIGLDIAQKTMVSSSPLDSTQFLDEVTTAQQYVDEVSDPAFPGGAVENIVLVTHYTYENDLALAQQVTGVDVIVGGDSHSLLGDPGDFGPFATATDGPYPTMTTNFDGDPVCVVQAWQYTYLVGELEATFQNGELLSCGGDPHMLVGNFTRDDVPITGAELAAIDAIITALPGVDHVEPDPEAQALLDTFSAQVDALAAQVIGTATEPLCLNRLPGDTRSAGICTTDQEAVSGARADVNGGFMQQIVTDAFLARSFDADIALQNAGGVRVALPAGPISIADVYEILPFANTLVNLELTGAEIVASLEEGAANFLDEGGSNGSYPYGSGIRWDADLTKPAGERFINVEVQLDDGTWVPIDLAATYTVVTNSFLAAGGDGYETFAAAVADGRMTDTLIEYAQAFVDWITENAAGVVSVPPASEFSTQTYIGPEGELMAPVGPVRLLDTRPVSGTNVGITVDGQFANGGTVDPGETLQLQVGGRDIVPPTATSVSVNLTVTEAAGLGYLTAWPCDQPKPLASVINYGPGETIANSIVVPLSAADESLGDLCISSGVSATHVIADVTGWEGSSAAYAPLTPARLLDTRPESGTEVGRTTDNLFEGTGLVAPGTRVELQVAGRGGVPANATAVTINLTATEGNGLGFATAWPCDATMPLASTLNFTEPPAIANATVVELSADGKLCLQTGRAATHLVADVTGAYSATDEFDGVVPARLLDTRARQGTDVGFTVDGQFEGAGTLTPGETLELQVVGRGGVPTGTRLVSINVTATENQGPGFLTLYACDDERPTASSVNYILPNTYIPNSVIMPVSGDGKICIYSGENTVHVVADVTAYYL